MAHDLDAGIQESFEFIVKGHKYRFRQLNTEEIEKLQEVSKDKDALKTKEFLFQFITKVDEKSPEFAEVAKQMIAPQWKKFQEMIKKEMGIESIEK